MPFAQHSSGRTSRWGSSSVPTDNTDPYTTDRLQKQIDNAKTRISDAGFTQQDADPRNWFEKSTNLPPGQNWFFDTLEILGRPGSAVKNVIDKSTGPSQTESVGEAAWRGFSGRDRVSGVDLARDRLGIDNKGLQFILGTGLDIGTDPTSFIPAGVLAKGVKTGVGFAAKPVKAGYNALENVAPKLKSLREDVVQPFGSRVKDSVGYMFNPDYKIRQTLDGGESDFLKNTRQQTDNSRRYMQEQALENLGRTARDAGGIGTGADVGRLMEKDLQMTRPPVALDDWLQTNKLDRSPENVARYLNETGNYHGGSAINGNIDLSVTSPDSVLGRGFYVANRRNVAEGYAELRGRADGKVYDVSSNFAKTLHLDDAPPPDVVTALVKTVNNKRFEDAIKRIPSLNSRKLFEIASSFTRNNARVINSLRQAGYDSMTYLRGAGKDAYLETSVINPESINLNEAAPEVSRPAREYSTDPKIQQAAQKLMESNDNIRQFAQDNGIAISELEGYMTHVWSKEERKNRIRVAAVDKGMRNIGNPNKSILNARELAGSAEDINDKVGRKFFEPNAFFATGIGQKRLIDYVHAVNFRRQVLSNPDFAQPFVKGMMPPANAEVIDVNNYKFLKESGDVLDGVVPAEQIGGKYIVTKQVKMLLDRYQKANTDEGTKAFMRAYDGIQSFWKRATLFSLGYHFRNQAGAMFNNYVAGMNPYELTKYTTQGFREVARAVKGNESPLFNEYRRQGLSSSALSQVEFARYGQEPEDAIQKTVQNMSKTKKGQVLQRINPLNAFQTSQEVGNFFDQSNRFALYKWAREKKGMSAEEAAAKVREVQFDYSHTTPFEQNVMTRVMPFYRWMKFNIPFQIRSFINDPRKYNYLNKARLNAQDVVGLNEDNIPDYMKENFSVPLYGENGKGRFLGLNLPLGDLTKLSRPGKTLVDAATPLLRTPAELALNYNMFRGKPIEKFAGQEKQYQIGDMEFGLPMKGAYAVEQATGQIGRGISGFLQKPESVDQDTKVRMPSLGISSLTKQFDAELYAKYSKLDELRQLQDLMLFIEQQQGDKPRTLAEIKKGSR